MTRPAWKFPSPAQTSPDRRQLPMPRYPLSALKPPARSAHANAGDKDQLEGSPRWGPPIRSHAIAHSLACTWDLQLQLELGSSVSVDRGLAPTARLDTSSRTDKRLTIVCFPLPSLHRGTHLFGVVIVIPFYTLLLTVLFQFITLTSHCCFSSSIRTQLI